MIIAAWTSLFSTPTGCTKIGPTYLAVISNLSGLITSILLIYAGANIYSITLFFLQRHAIDTEWFSLCFSVEYSGPVFAIDIRAFELIEKPRQSQGLLSAPTARCPSTQVSLTGSLESNSAVRPERPRYRIADRWPARFAHILTQSVGLGQGISGRWPADASPHRISFSTKN